MDLKNIADIYPLSPVQDEELSRHRRLSSSSGASPVEQCGQIVCHLRGRLDAARLEAAWAQMATGHTALRSFFVWEKLEKALRLIPKQLAISVEQHDWSGDAADGGEARLRNFLTADAARGFDPAAPPLVRLSLCRESEDSHQLVFTYHRLLLDERSARFVLDELFKSYEAGGNGDAASHPRPDFKSYIEWLKRQDATAGESLWRDALDGFDAPAQFLSERDADTSAAHAHARGHERLTLAPATLSALRTTARQHGLDLADAIRAAWAVVLSGYSGAPEVLFGVRVAARPPELGGSESIVGAFANTLPARVRVTRTDTVAALLRQLGEGRSRAKEFEYSTATQSAAGATHATNGAEPSTAAPLFESVLGVRETSEADPILWAGAGLEVGETLARCGEVSPLVVEARATADGTLVIETNYDAGRFDAEGASRLLGHLREVLEGIAAADAEQQPVSALSLLPDAERRLLAGWNDTRTLYPRDRAVHELFEEQVARTPDTVAIVAEGVSLSYGELNARSNQLANYLRSLGVGAEMLVGICMERSVEMIVGLLGVLKAGGAYVPLDPAYPLERLSFMLEDTQTPVLLTQERLLEELPAHWGQVVCLDDDWETIALHGAENQPGGAGADNLVYVMYTSGSTGRPKGVGVTHRSVVRLVKETNYAHFLPEDVFLQLAPFSFDASTFEIWGALLNGARLALMPARTPSLDEIGDALNAYGVTTVWLTAGLFHLMVNERPQDLANLRQLLAGGDVLSVPHVRAALDQLKDGRVINGYGPTESTTFAVCHPMSSGEELGASVPIGRVISNTHIHIVNRQMETLPVGVAGELLIGGDGLARGYLNRPELTAERFIPDPFSTEPGARLYRTGDLARFGADGSVEFLGRIDQQVKVRGFRVELGEIEAALGGHPSVRDCVVTAREDAPGDKRLAAYVVAAAAGAEASAAELRSYLKGKLPEYMLPSVFVMLDELPLTPNGKVDRRALPAPDASRPELEETFAPPTTPEEQTLTEIWAQVLGLARVGINDNFFDLGGDSIRSIQIRAQAQARGLDFSIQQLFQYQTIHELAQVVEVISAAEASAGKSVRFGLVSEEDRLRLPADVEDAYPLSRLQAGMLFHSDFNPESAIYHDMFSFHLQTPHELETLMDAIRQLMARHAVLRTSFDLTSYGEPLQLVHRVVEPSVEVCDLRHLTHDEQEKTLTAEFEAEKKVGFDWKVAPLIRFKVCRRAEAAMQFDVGFHHAILDGWSVASMLTELFQLYLAMLRGDADSLPAAPVASFREFIALERAALTSDESQRFWNELLRDSPSTLLPRLTSTDKASASVVRQLPVDVPREVSDGVRQLAQAGNVPVKSVLLAAHLRVMSLLAGQADVVTGVVANGRPEERDGERVLGLFLNNLPFRFRLEGGSWRDLVRETFEAERAIVPHRRYPMVELQRALGGQTLFETCFNFTHFHVYQGVLDLDGIAPVDVKFFEESNFPVTTQFSQDITSQRVLLRLDYMTGEMSDEQMNAVARYYVNTLTAMTTEPEARYETCALLAETERRQLLEEWNDTTRDYPRDSSIHQLFEAQAAATPEQIALTFGDEQLTYGELNARANQLAHHLRALGVGPEVMVGLCLERSVELIVGLIGVLKAGGIYAPLDAAYPLERLAFMVNDLQAPVLLTQDDLVDRLPIHWGQVISLDADWDEIAVESRENPVNRTLPDNLAYVMYTSGTTGRPKGVSVTHRGVMRLVRGADYATLGSDETILQFAPVSFDASTFEIWGALLNGGRLVLMPPGAPSMNDLASALEQHQVTTLWLTAGLFHLMVDEQLEALRPVRQLLAGGDVLSVPHVRAALEGLPATRLINGYGPTESTTFACCHQMSGQFDGDSPVPIGRPISNTTVFLLDARMQPVPVGTPGELYIGGDGLARGYLNRPELTAEKFVPHPFANGQRLYRTGDLARFLPDGRIEFVGRIDQQVKVRGFRIELGEIEAALGGHPSVRECVVLARADTPGEKRLVAYIVSDAEETDDAHRLRDFLKTRLPEYMIPSAFVVLDALPLNPNGKVDRKALPSPEQAQTALTSGFVAPRTPVEEMLANLWCDVLGVARVGVNDNFFELGGDSIRSIQVMSRVRAAFSVELPLRTLFDSPTVATLAPALTSALAPTLGGAGLQERPPLNRSKSAGTRPLSFAQQRLWFLDQLMPGSAAYNVPVALRLRGELDAAALAGALSEVERRHEALRTTLVVSEDVPAQIVNEATPIRLPVEDLSELPPDLREAEARRLAEEEAVQGFDLTRGPVWRARLLRLSADDHVLLVTLHHIVSDAWSLGIIVRELSSLYRSLAAGEEPTLEELEIQYGDYAEWQRAWLQGEALETQLAYWREQLAGGGDMLALPTDRPRPPVQTYRGATQEFAVSAEVGERLKALSRREGATLFMTLLAAFQTLLHRYAGREDISVGTPIAGRAQLETEALVGFFVNTLVLRTELRGEMSFNDAVRRVRDVALGAYAHQDIPFERLVEELQPERTMSHTPLFQVMFVLQNAPTETLELPGLKLSLMPADNSTAKFDLTMSMAAANGDALSGSLAYNTDLFDAVTIRRMTDHFQNLLTAVAADPEGRLSEVPLMNEAERQQQLVEWNDTHTIYTERGGLHELFEQQAARTPEAIAVVFEEEEMTYAELNRRANQLAHHLRGLGVGTDTLVGIMAERSVEMVTGLLGILKAGGAYVPLDAEYPAERLSFMLEDARVSVLLTQERLLERIPEYAGHIICLDAEQETLARENDSNPAVNISPESLAYMIYTSGSTGRPKGAMNTHAAIRNRLLWMQDEYRLTTNDSVLQKTPFSFDVSVWEFFWPLITGARLVVARPGGHRDAAYLVQLIARQQITTLHFVPSMLQVFLDETDLSGCASLQRVICSGEALSIELQERLFSRLTAPQLHNLYGPTEAAVDVTYWACQREGERRRSVPIGQPIANTQIYIVDQQMNPVPMGVAGELLIGGVGLARGYFDRPALTAEKFIADPFSTEAGARLYRTGDLARFLSDGNVEYLGRLDHQVKIRGHRIELGEIEAALEQHAEVKEALLVAREEAGGNKRLVAYLVAGEGATPDAPALRSYLKTRLPEYMIPSVFVMLDEMPLTPNGKVDRKALPAPDASQSASGQPFVAPRTPAEEMLANIWCDVLGVARVGVNDNFFDLGGHSLLATQVMSRVRAAFSIEVPLRTLFNSPTVAMLASALASTLGGEGLQTRPPLRRQAASSGTRPLSFAQQRLWFLDQLTPGSAAYNVPVALRLRGELDAAALSSALAEVEHRHEALRTKFVKVDGLPAQVVGEATGAPLVFDDLRQLPADMRAEEARRLASEAARLPFDLADGPVWRARLLRLSEDDHVLLVTLHHIVSDAWSLGVIVRELSSLYRAFAAGEESALPELELQYGDYAEWQRAWLQGEALEEQLSFWRTQLAGGDDVLALPTDRPYPPTRSYVGARHEFRVSAEASGRLRELSRREGATLFMTLLAAWQALLARYSGQEKISVGTPIAGRAQLETEALIGFFVNTLVLRTDMSGEPTFGQLLRRVREVCLGAFNHQDVPFEKLVEELQPERTMSHSPLFQVMFSLQNAPIGALELPGLTLREMSPEGEGLTEKFDITLTMHEAGDSIGGTFSYSTDLFDHATVERMAEHFMRLLEEAALAPEQPISELELMTEAERRRLLVEWNDTRADYARERVLHELFEEQVARTPEAIAVVSGNENLTYAELDGRANQLAHHLRGLGVGTESLVAVCAERSVEMVVGLLGVLKAGGAYVPLDPNYPLERLSYMLEDARASVLLTQERLLEKLSGVAARVVCLDADWEIIAGESVASPRVHVGAENPAYVIYTSGSTGRPKGVVISHSAICNHMTWMQAALPLDASDAVLQKTPFSFDASVWEFYAPLLAGARLVMAEPGGHQDGSYLVRVVEEERITILQTVPSLLRMLLAVPGLRRCRTLRRLFCGGEPLTRELQERLYEQLDAVTLYNLYGPTEATIEAGAWECEREGERRVVPIGRPISNAQMYVLDKHRQPVPQGTVGELYIGGAGLARGYLHRPDLTAQKFIPHPFSEEPGARLYQTGDLARHLPDGAIEFLGRADHQVKVRGFRIELGEIEAALNELEAVRECAVIAWEDTPGEKRLVAYLVAGAGGMAPASELRELLRAKLPEHMIPTLFVELDELPLTPNGKLDRRALPVPARAGSEAGRNFVAPRTAVEEIVAELWAESLGLERLGVRDNFFEVGGHSLVAALLISRLRYAFQIDIPLSVFFNTTPTVERMSEAIEMLLIEQASDGDVEKMLAELDELSDDEVKAVLTGGNGRAESNTEAL